MSDTTYAYPGAAALVALHEEHLRAFCDTWRQAAGAGTSLPSVEDPSYASLEHLLGHVLGAAAHYMTWVCEQLDLPAPDYGRSWAWGPVAGADLDAALASVLSGWDGPLATVLEEQCEKGEYRSAWKMPYTIDSMLEHAVMHPIRHGYQLQRLMGTRP